MIKENAVEILNFIARIYICFILLINIRELYNNDSGCYFQGKNDSSASGLKPPPSAALQYSGLFRFESERPGCLALLRVRPTLRLWPLILECCGNSYTFGIL